MSNSTTSSQFGTAVITGASSGIGRAYADRLAGRGYDLLLIARRGERLAAAASEIRLKHRVEVTTVVADLADSSELKRISETIATDKSVTLLVNNAGTATMAPVASTTADQMSGMIELNVTAVAALTLAVLPGFLARDNGTIINIGSVLGFATRAGVSTIYSGTKAFVMHYTRGLQDELAHTRIRVQLVMPAATATEIWDVGGIPLTRLDPKIVMRVDSLVDAALAGLDSGELVTMPSVPDADAALLKVFDETRIALYGHSQTGTPASRYGVPTRRA